VASSFTRDRHPQGLLFFSPSFVVRARTAWKVRRIRDAMTRGRQAFGDERPELDIVLGSPLRAAELEATRDGSLLSVKSSPFCRRNADTRAASDREEINPAALPSLL
jgi:hypothetical protein